MSGYEMIRLWRILILFTGLFIDRTILKGYENMKQFLCSKLKKFIFRKSSSDELSDKIQELEKQIERIKLQINDRQVIKIEKVIVEKIFCEKVETNYRIDSITTENLSGTMNVGTIYPSSHPMHGSNEKENEEKEPLEQSEPREPKVNMFYK